MSSGVIGGIQIVLRKRSNREDEAIRAYHWCGANTEGRGGGRESCWHECLSGTLVWLILQLQGLRLRHWPTAVPNHECKMAPPAPGGVVAELEEGVGKRSSTRLLRLAHVDWL